VNWWGGGEGKVTGLGLVELVACVLRVERLVDTLQADVNGAVAILNALLHVRGLDGIHCGLFHLIHPKGGEAYSPM
jgi:hypothetical protein